MKRNTLINIAFGLTIGLLGMTAAYTYQVQQEGQNQPIFRLETSTPEPLFTLAVTPAFIVPGEATGTPELTATEVSTNTPSPFQDRNQHFVYGSNPEPKLEQTELASNYVARK